MSSPKPPFPLKDQCSVILDDTLYVYSPDGFLSLPLQLNSTWSALPNGVSVTGAKCVQGLDNGPGSGQALWIVGGAANETSQDYPGLQKYSFTSKAWSTVEPVVKVTQNRQNHGAAFLNATGQILVYAGSQDDPDTPSIETFVISTTEPYNVLSYSSHNDPVIAPVLLQWDDSSAIAIGGTQNTDVYRFSFDPDTNQGSWHDYPTKLSAPLKDPNKAQAVLVQGTDNSKVLEMFDMSVQPAEASTLVLQDANGHPAQTGETVGGGGSSKLKRDLTLTDWPSYNSTAAPDYTLNGFSVAQGANGVVAMTGGNDDHPVSLFDDASNAWVDTTQFFGPQKDVNQQAFISPTSSSTAPTHAATSAAPTNTGFPGVPDHHKTSVILGAVLGSILGLITILVIILLFFYLRKKKKQQADNAAAEEEKRRMSFADRGAPFMMEGGGHQEKEMAHNSIALMGNSVNHGRPDTRGSDTSMSRLIPRKAPPGHFESHEMSPIGENSDASSHIDGNRTLPLASDSERGNSGYLSTPQRNSGWSRYFGSGSAAAAGAAAGTAGASGLRKVAGRNSADTYSNYTTDSSHDCSTHGPTEIPPLKMGEHFEKDRISRVVTGSPPTSPPTTGYGNRSSESRTRTLNSEISMSSIDETFYGKPAHEDSWSPVSRNDWSNLNAMDAKVRDTTASSIYSHTPRNSESKQRGLKPIVEDHGAKAQTARISNAPSAQSSRYSEMPTPNAARASDLDAWPRPPSSGHASAVRTPSVKTMNSARTADSPPPLPQSFQHELEPPDEFAEEEAPATPTAITAIPVPASTAMQYTVRKPSPKPVQNSDMSWINLGPLENRKG